MRFSCPNGHPVNFGEAVCSHCGAELSVGNYFRSIRRSFVAAAKERISLQCPRETGKERCSGKIRLFETRCDECHGEIEFSFQVPPGVTRTLKKKTTKQRIARYAYLLGSIWLTVFLFNRVIYLPGHPLMRVLLSIGHLCALTVLARIVLKGEIFHWIFHRASHAVRLALICNYLTVFCLLQVLMAVWPDKSIALFAVYIVIWLANYMFVDHIYPVLSWLAFYFVPGDDTVHTTRKQQGRRASYDRAPST